MAKRRTFKEILKDKLDEKPSGQWFKVYGNPDYDKIIAAVKELIDEGGWYGIKSDYQSIRREYRTWNGPGIELECLPWHEVPTEMLPVGIVVRKINPGFKEEIEVKHEKRIIIEHREVSYRVFRNDKLIAIEN